MPLEAQRVCRGITVPLLSLSSRWGWVVSVAPHPLYPRQRPCTYFTGDWMGPRACLDECEEENVLDPPGFKPLIVQPVAVSTTYPGPCIYNITPNSCGVEIRLRYKLQRKSDPRFMYVCIYIYFTNHVVFQIT